MNEKLIAWTIGLFVSLVVGHFVAGQLVAAIRRQVGCYDKRYKKYLKRWYYTNKKKENFKVRPLSPCMQGIVERLFFTVITAFNVQGAPIAMMAWLGVKMVTNLNRGGLPQTEIVRSRALTGLMGAMVSMLFSFLGGLLCNQTIPLPKILGAMVSMLF